MEGQVHITGGEKDPACPSGLEGAETQGCTEDGSCPDLEWPAKDTRAAPRPVCSFSAEQMPGVRVFLGAASRHASDQDTSAK